MKGHVTRSSGVTQKHPFMKKQMVLWACVETIYMYWNNKCVLQVWHGSDTQHFIYPVLSNLSPMSPFKATVSHKLNMIYSPQDGFACSETEHASHQTHLHIFFYPSLTWQGLWNENIWMMRAVLRAKEKEIRHLYSSHASCMAPAQQLLPWNMEQTINGKWTFIWRLFMS